MSEKKCPSVFGVGATDGDNAGAVSGLSLHQHGGARQVPREILPGQWAPLDAPILSGFSSGNTYYVFCPFCRRWLQHSFSSDEIKRLTHRVSHCQHYRQSGYWIRHAGKFQRPRGVKYG